MRFTTQTCKLKAVFLDSWLLKLEMAAFGWNYGSSYDEYSHTSTEVNYDAGTATTRNHYVTMLEFYRVKPFSHNILFKLTELLSNIVSFIRRIAMMIFGPLAVLVGVVWLLSAVACDEPDLAASTQEVAIGLGILYAGGLFAPSFILAALGYLWRKVFGIDEKLKRELRENGYSDDLSDPG